jgi:hypothetical protein
MDSFAITPSHRTTLWLAANVLWFSSIPALGSFLVRELKSGAFPTDGDSIGIPLFGWVSVTVVLAPVLNTAWWWLSRNYPGSVFLFVTDKRTDTRSHIVSIGLIALAGTLVAGGVWELLSGAPEIAAVVLSWCYLTLAFRAAFLRRRALAPTLAG